MNEKPDIVKILKEEERSGMLQSRVQKSYNEVDVHDELFENTPDKTVGFIEDESVEKKDGDVINAKTPELNFHKVEEKYRLISEHTSDLIAITTFKMNPTYTYVSPSHKKVLGYEPEEMIGKHSFDFLHPDDKKKLRPLLKRYLGMKVKNLLTGKAGEITENLEFRLRDKSKNWHYMESTANIIGNELLFISKDITERKKAEGTLIRSEEKFRTIFENSAVAITFTDKNERIVSWNTFAEKLLGKGKKDLYMKPVESLYPPDEWKKIRSQDIRQKGMQHHLETKIYGKNNELIDVDISLSVLKDERGKITGSIGVIKDISDQKMVEKKIAESEDRYYDLFENANDLIQAVTTDGSFLYVNRAWKQTLGYNEDEIQNLSIFDIIHPDSKEHCMKIFKHVMSGKSVERIEASFVSKDKKVIVVDGSVNCRFKDGKPFSTRGIFRDITERKKVINEIEKTRHELEVKNQELKNTIKYAERVSLETKNALTELDQIFNTTGNGMIVIDKDFHILKMNDTFSTMFGVKKAEAIGRKCHEILNEDACHTENCPLKKILDGEKYVELETEIKHSNGTNIPCSLTATPFEKVDGDLVGIIENFKDITGWKKAEKKIKKQNVELEKLNNIKSAFLNVTSHELRTPMSAIKGYVQMMAREKLGDINEDQKNALEVVLRNAETLDHLIQDILDISRLESGTMKFIPYETDVDKLVEEIVETMSSPASLKKIKIDTNIGKDIPNLVIDPERIKQAIVNLTSNAIKFSPDGSVINLRVKKDKDNVLFEVQDHGRGIPKEHQERIFEIFYQVESSVDAATKFGGCGLGLAISRGIVLAHGGCIWVESKGISGKGSTFRFTLPIKSVKNIEERFKGVDVFGIDKEHGLEKNKDIENCGDF